MLALRGSGAAGGPGLSPIVGVHADSRARRPIAVVTALLLVWTIAPGHAGAMLAGASPAGSGPVGAAPVGMAATATHSISGTVTDAAGRPVRGIRVDVLEYPNPDHQASATTAADGTYTAPGLPPGEYTLMFTDPSGTYPTSFWVKGGFTLDLGAEDSVTIRSANVTGIDVAYPPVRRLAGTVTAADGKPIAGADVAACPSLPNYTSPDDPACRHATTAADGTFSLTVVAYDYAIRVSDAGAAPGQERIMAQWYTTTGDIAGAPEVVQVDADVSGLAVRLLPLARVSGRLTIVGSRHARSVTICRAVGMPLCFGGFTRSDGPATIDYTAASEKTKVVIQLDSPGIGGAATLDEIRALPGFWSRNGVVADRARATVVDLTAGDATGIDATLRPMTVGIHAGASRSGSFGSMPVTVAKGSKVTLRIGLGTGFSRMKVVVQAAPLDARGRPGAFRDLETRTVAADGTVVFTTTVSRSSAFRAIYIPPEGVMGNQDPSVVVIAKVR